MFECLSNPYCSTESIMLKSTNIDRKKKKKKKLLNTQIYSEFYIFLLKSTNFKTFVQMILHNFKKYENEYKIEKILQQKD